MSAHMKTIRMTLKRLSSPISIFGFDLIVLHFNHWLIAEEAGKIQTAQLLYLLAVINTVFGYIAKYKATWMHLCSGH